MRNLRGARLLTLSIDDVARHEVERETGGLDAEPDPERRAKKRTPRVFTEDRDDLHGTVEEVAEVFPVAPRTLALGAHVVRPSGAELFQQARHAVGVHDLLGGDQVIPGDHARKGGVILPVLSETLHVVAGNPQLLRMQGEA